MACYALYKVSWPSLKYSKNNNKQCFFLLLGFLFHKAQIPTLNEDSNIAKILTWSALAK